LSDQSLSQVVLSRPEKLLPQCFPLTRKVSFEGAVKGQQANVGDTYPCFSTLVRYVALHLQLPGWSLIRKCGRVWFIALVLKTSVPERVPWVRILPLPPLQASFVVLEINETGIVIGPCSHRVIADVKQTRGAYGAN
jgi:hypothetical protein